MRHLFITGCPSSGTTALANLLNTDERIAIGIERYKYVAAKVDQAFFEKDKFLNIDVSETDIINRKLYEKFRYRFENNRLEVVGDKLATYSKYLSKIANRIPRCKCIILMRDLYSVASSYNLRARDKEDRWPEFNDYRVALRHWHENLLTIDKLFKSLTTDQIFIVQYERFFSGELEYLIRLYEFLEVSTPDNLSRMLHDCIEQGKRTLSKPLDLNATEYKFLKSNKNGELEARCLRHCPDQRTKPGGIRDPLELVANWKNDQRMLRINNTPYDFLDFGPSHGDSTKFAKEHLTGLRGLGIDLDVNKVKIMKKAGFDCIKSDVLKLDLPEKSVRFVVISHFLDYLHDLNAVEEAIKKAAGLATDFLFIRGPYYDADDYLKSLRLKFYWSDWRGHKCHLTLSDLKNILEKCGLNDFEILVKAPVENSDHEAIHPLDSPPDQHKYDESIHPPKPSIAFDRPIFGEMIVPVRLRHITYWQSILHAVDGTTRYPM